MLTKRTFVSWVLAGASATSFVIGAGLPVGSALQDPPPAQQQDPPVADAGAGRGGRGAAQGPRPYATVITSAFKTDEGIFKVHRGPVAGTDSVLFEIPAGQLDKDFVWNVSIKKTTIGVGYGGQSVSSRVVRWVKRGDRILLESRDYSITADPNNEVAAAVAAANYPAIIRTLPVAAYAANGDAVVDVTTLFMEGAPEFSARGAVGGRGMDATRSFLERAVSFPENINVEATLTFTGAEAAAGGGGGRGATGMRGASGTVLVHHSLMKLPEQPMMPRNFDERVGFGTEALVDFGTDEHRSVRERIIQRFRLVKKDPAAAVSEPVTPIVFYVDPATPAKWVPAVKAGIESWQAAFEAAGFRNAIVAKDAPANDPDWSAEDARYSIVKWVPTPTETQSLITDPRSGEILSARIDVYPNVSTFGPLWYFVQASPLDKRAQTLPLPDAVSGDLLRYQVAHGIGHALGMPHNLKASSTYTIAQVRDPKWVKEMGFVASIMDDARFNYVAQPEDGVDVADLIPKVGPYDKFAVSWGYKPIPTAKSSEMEHATLDQWAREQTTKAYLRFSTEGAAATDVGENAEAVGDIDAVAASTLGLKNLGRVADLMMKATSGKVGDPWDDLEAVYARMVAQWGVEMNAVVKVVGGQESQQLHIGQEGMRFKTVPKTRQVDAVQFLVNNAFQVPAFMVNTDVLRRIQASGAVDRVKTAQAAVLTSLLQNQRLDRMLEQLTIDGASVAYSPFQLLADVRAGLWSEAVKPGTASIYRRNLQRAYLEAMDAKLNGTPASSAEIRMLVKGELRALDKQLQTAIAANGLDENTRRHFTDAKDEIETILDPRVSRPEPAAGAAGAAAGRGRGGVSSLAAPEFSPATPQRGGGGGPAAGGQTSAGPKPYAEVITAAAKTDDGIFKVHRLTEGNNDRLFYEIPKAELDKDFLWNTQIKKTTIGAGYGGQAVGSRVVRWVLKGDRVLVQNMDYSIVADPANPLPNEAAMPAIIRTFPVAAYAPSGDPVIDVTALYTSDVSEFSARTAVGGRGMDATRTFLEKAVSYPQNVNVEVTATYTTADAAAAPAAPDPAPAGRGRAGGRGPSATVLLHHSMIKLPEQPMMPRLFDERVGYFTQGLTDFGTGEVQQAQKRFITRYRLEKKDPTAAISEPVKPITYYVDPATPKKWVPCVSAGIVAWQPAFEAAGFKNGIIAKEAPSKAEDPDWSGEDVRYSTIVYLPSTTENAVGPHVHDPRSGEILEADVQYYHNVMNLAKNWYFVQASPLDTRAQQLPLPDDLMCTLVTYVVAHEVGHTLGFQHNMKASSTYTIDQIRNPAWVKENSHTPTLMDYSRFNYVAQPEDKIDPKDLVPKIGPYDKWATHWGYAPIPNAKTPEQEKPTLDAWAREQDAKPYLRFSTEGQGTTDPGDNTEAVGDADAVTATSLGIKNLSRVSEMLVSATSYKTGAPWDELEEVYGRMVGQWTTEMGHVVKLIGGYDSQQKHIGQDGPRFVTVPKARQQEALRFLMENAFTTPAFMIRPDILRRIQPTGILDRVRGMHAGLMGQLLQAARLDRMAEQADLDGEAAYSPLQFLTELRAGVWSELGKPGAVINIYRRNLQRAYLDNMNNRLNGAGGADEVRALVKGEIRALDRQLQTALTTVTDDITRLHLLDCRDEISKMLDRLVPRPAPAAGAGRGGRGGGLR
jgi:hypothetical protein